MQNFAQRYAEWAAAQATLIEAQNNFQTVGAQELAASTARAEKLWMVLWQEDGLGGDGEAPAH